MNGTNLFKIALRALANNKLRAFLTMLGIIIGVASVITMLAIGQGSKKSIQQQISEMGSNMIMIHPGADMRGGVRQDPSAMQTLKLTDYEALRDETKFLSAISPNVSSSGQLIAGNNNYPASVNGIFTLFLNLNGGGGGIRTLVTLYRPNGFRDRRIQPLCHPSAWGKNKAGTKACFGINWRRVRDLNPGDAFDAYTISNRAPSATRTTLR